MKSKKVFISVFCLVIISLFSVHFWFSPEVKYSVSSAVKLRSMPTVIVDAGHGGEDGGAVALDNSNEKDYNLDIALKLQRILELNGFNVIMTRTGDVMTCDKGLKSIRSRKISDIYNRFALMEKHPDAIFVSIHQNKFNDENQKGTQVFYSGNNDKSNALAQSIQQNIKDKLQPENNRMIKKSGTEIYLLYHAKIPAVLVECGFVSNYEDLKKLKTDEYKTQLAMLIAEGIINYRSGG